MGRSAKSSSSASTHKIYSQASLSVETIKEHDESKVPRISEHFHEVVHKHSFCRGIGTNAQLNKIHETDFVQNEETGRILNLDTKRRVQCSATKETAHKVE